ncbi:fumarylacetoacetate hydrolase family protein [Hydrogenophaga sp.]|uniref:fumarylacetoacetate hydrolase family protein n=1 Tax=Hydrogenophaga sp. TaxID=1904254 RepID=UPI003569A53B
MKLISFVRNGTASYGAVTDKGVVDLGEQLKYPDLKALLAANAVDEARTAAGSGKAIGRLEDLELLPVIPNPGKIYCIGHNYEDHRKETNRPKVDHPSVFMRYPEAQTGHLRPLVRPHESTMFDYEGEIAIVIGKAGRRIQEADAWNHVAGYACYNEGSVRDWQWHTQQFGPGKNFFQTGAFGPWLLTADEIAAGEVLSLITRLNGEVMQQTDTTLMIFPIPRLIAYCSTFLPLAAGDVIVTGTPGGVGAKRTPPVWLKDGDVCEIEVSKVGVLRNTVAAG